MPVVIGDDLELRVYTSPADLAIGAYGIEEPTGALFTDYATIDLVIVPGVAFDRDGNRLGRGKGYYDRLLPRIPSAYKVGICFPFQIVEEVPAEPFDIRMDEIMESLNIIEQLIDNIPEGPYQEKMKPIIRVPEGSYYAAVEGSRGEFGVFLESQGDKTPYRLHYASRGIVGVYRKPAIFTRKIPGPNRHKNRLGMRILSRIYPLAERTD